ncbi:hypothetical protein Aperf_G00000040340 [Anoplocephala perfoliata]
MAVSLTHMSNFPVKTYPITEDYEITQQSLGTGINGRVLKCIHKLTGRVCALKVLGDDEKAHREVEIHYRVRDCENIVSIVDIFRNNNTNTGHDHLLIVMECMEGGELFNRIQQRHHSGFTENDAAQIVYQIANAIYWLHSRNIAHRDLKPENLLFESDAPDATLKLTDFGFAKETSGFLKTPCFSSYYAAPEIFSSVAYDQQCDMWSLGVITYILLCGYPPFYSSGGDQFSPGMKDRIKSGCYTFPPNEWNEVSNLAKDLIKKLLIIQPQDRLTIEGVMQHPWIVFHQRVPETPLHTLDVLNCEKMNWSEIQEGFRENLQMMRKESNTPRLKKLPDASNNLLRRRIRASGSVTPTPSMVAPLVANGNSTASTATTSN